MKISDTHLSWLRAFGPDSRGINIPYSIAKTMEIKGLVEWMPPQVSPRMWVITEKGKRVRRENEHRLVG